MVLKLELDFFFSEWKWEDGREALELVLLGVTLSVWVPRCFSSLANITNTFYSAMFSKIPNSLQSCSISVFPCLFLGNFSPSTHASLSLDICGDPTFPLIACPFCPKCCFGVLERKIAFKKEIQKRGLCQSIHASRKPLSLFQAYF